ncbi:MAG: rhodanese-like domain-containing protein, partial [Pseudomonadota bacterium]
LINQQKALVIDTRGKEDFDAGHIIDAVHVEGDNIDDSGALKKRGKQPLLIYCEQGSSSTRTVKRLSASGMTDVYALKGGLSAWRRQNLPLAKDDL